VVPRLACSPGGRHGRLDARFAGPPAQCYAVVCTPRTGSTFYCELLQAGGLGAPREHLRSALVHVLRAPGVRTAQVFDEVLAWGQSGGVFGTKLISHFLDDAVGPHAVRDTLACLAARGWRFIHLDRDPAEQAVSKYMAARTDLWHVRGRVEAGHVQRLAQVPFDAAALRAMHDAVQRERQHLADALAALPPACLLRVDYDKATADPQAALARAATHLGCPVPAPVPLDRLPVKVSAQVPLMGRMVGWLRGEAPAAATWPTAPTAP
jgi:LPS sulfotransferase NodH